MSAYVNYTPPAVQVGDIVHWFHDGVKRPGAERAAIVKQVTPISIFLCIFDEDRTIHKEGVRHCDDPNARESDRVNEGGWCHKKAEKIETAKK